MNSVAPCARAVTTPPARDTANPSSMIFLRPNRSPRLPAARILAATQSVPVLAASARSAPTICRALPAATTAMLWMAGSALIGSEAPTRASRAEPTGGRLICASYSFRTRRALPLQILARTASLIGAASMKSLLCLESW